jgi:diaminopimelate epimerase
MTQGIVCPYNRGVLTIETVLSMVKPNLGIFVHITEICHPGAMILSVPESGRMTEAGNQTQDMPTLANQNVLKMNGLGNEIVVMDLRGKTFEVTASEARAIGRSKGLLFDQMMVLHDPRTAETEAFVLIYNIDGTQAGACGNGTRCVAWYLAQQTGKTQFSIETRAGILACERIDEWQFCVDMGKPALGWQQIPLSFGYPETIRIPLETDFLKAGYPADFTAVSMGNPHAVFFVDDVEMHDLARTGPLLEKNALFPEKANISLAHVTSRSTLVLKVWERSAGLTRACGSGACAAAVAAHRRGLTERKVTVTLPGGDLKIDWRRNDHVMMTGPVELEFTTSLTPDLFDGAA